ncbi:hypothetical protein E5676_scaffold368G00010 [Cucumis melo var. makuwa]|uniref:Uncharacterized protein n=1 Tax=Cucumis melo var. makuwa TaxID=1194695 RepID=A0A5D3D645_CUCMM|nr:hypothetical protein E6C27_scaffold163G001250 [Cucumis melo var. makuwa]TYK19034.1 hypothetical protein E5676_scaffold368G00010 [Cucumis melo var. makuwa]
MKEEEEVDAYYVFKFIDKFICKPLERGFEDTFQCQSNLQEMQLRSQKQVSDLELKIDNASASNQAQMDQFQVEVKKLKMQIKSSKNIMQPSKSKTRQ